MTKRILTVLFFCGTLFALLIGGFSCNPSGGAIALRSPRQSDSLLTHIQNRGKLIAITSYSSTNYFIHQGEPLGYQYELLHSLADKLGVHLDIIVENDVNKSVEMLNEGKADIIARDLAITTLHAQEVSFTDPILQTQLVLVQRKPADWKKLNDKEIDNLLIRDPKSLKGKTVFIQAGSSYDERLTNLQKEQNAKFKINADEDRDVEDLIAAVAHKEIDYTICDEQLAAIDNSIYKNIDVKTPLSGNQNIAWAVKKDNASLLEEVNAWLREFKKTPQASMIYDKYYKNPRGVKLAQKQQFKKRGNQLSPYDNLIRHYSKQIGWDWRLMAALIYEESHFQPRIVSWDGALGLMQLSANTARKYGISIHSTVEKQLAAGTQYLKKLTNIFSKQVKDKEDRNKFVLASYNIGLSHVIDARNLTTKYKHNPGKWSDNVEVYLRNKSKPEYYNDTIVKNGFARGDRTCDYVDRIFERYRIYRNIAKR
ncbi:MAG: transporter substrate-binding domain-containing protein [Bacteroidota bacterium]|nr:transporter substrate-binding domain-containing protein [Bacteroidota bacterium]